MKCIDCGSEKIIPKVTHMSDPHMSLATPKVQIFEKPDVSVLKQPKLCKTYANVCGYCGKVELYVENPKGIWERCLKALKNLE